MIKTILSTSVLCLMAGIGSAQKVSYTVVKDEPSKYKPTMAYIEAFNADTHIGATIGYGLKLETLLLGRILPSVLYRGSYLDANASHVVSGYPTVSGGQKKGMTIEAGSALFLTSKERKRNLRVVLSSRKSGNVTTTHYIMAPGTVKKMMGVHAGFNVNRRSLEFDDDSHTMYDYKAPNGTLVPIPSVGNGGANVPAGEYYQPLSTTNIVSLYAGGRIRRVTNLVLDVDGRKKRNDKVNDWYADVMLAPVVPISDVVDINGVKWGIEAKSGSIRNLGWRVGLMSRGSGVASFAYNFEFGQKPGPKMGKGFMDNGTYISIGCGMSLAFRKIK